MVRCIAIVLVLTPCLLSFPPSQLQDQKNDQEAVQKKNATFELDLGGGVKMTFVRIEPGTFMMGASDAELFDEQDMIRGNKPDVRLERPRHEVRITRPFYLAIYPVTQAQYQKIIGENPSYFKVDGGALSAMKGLDTSNFPVDRVEWRKAKEFCRKLTALPALKAKEWTADLPTEAQWEYACRAGTKTKYYLGDDDTALDKVGWYYRNSDKRTHPVGEKVPNAWGIYDMHGNVNQWCSDWYAGGYYKNSPPDNPTGPDFPEKGTDAHVARGGCWTFDPLDCRAASRYWQLPEISHYIGFRVAILLSPQIVLDDLLEENRALRQQIEKLEKRLADREQKK